MLHMYGQRPVVVDDQTAVMISVSRLKSACFSLTSWMAPALSSGSYRAKQTLAGSWKATASPHGPLVSIPMDDRGVACARDV